METDPKADFISRTRNHTRVAIFYEKTGKPREHIPKTIREFLDANTTFTSIVDTEDHNIDTIWVGKTTLVHNTEMHFVAVLSEDNGDGDVNTSQITITISSNPNITREFTYILM